MLMVGVKVGRAAGGCPPEFVATFAGVFSIAAGAVEVVLGAGVGASLLGGRTCTTRCGAIALCGVAGEAAGAGRYRLKALGRGAGVSLSLSEVALGLF